jgi:hypothetical protein
MFSELYCFDVQLIGCTELLLCFAMLPQLLHYGITVPYEILDSMYLHIFSMFKAQVENLYCLFNC